MYQFANSWNWTKQCTCTNANALMSEEFVTESYCLTCRSATLKNLISHCSHLSWNPSWASSWCFLRAALVGKTSSQKTQGQEVLFLGFSLAPPPPLLAFFFSAAFFFLLICLGLRTLPSSIASMGAVAEPSPQKSSSSAWSSPRVGSSLMGSL